MLSERSYGWDMPEPTASPPWRQYSSPELDPVLSAAVEAFNEVGYHAATVRDIARRAGLSVAGIYHHHAGKQEMLVALMTTSMNELIWRNAAAREAGGNDPVARFCNQIETLTLSHIYWQKITAVGSTEMRSLKPDNRTRMVAMRTELQQHIQNDVDLAVEHRLFTTKYPREAVRAVVSMCLVTGQWYRDSGELSPQQIAARTVEIALDTVAYEQDAQHA